MAKRDRIRTIAFWWTVSIVIAAGIYWAGMSMIGGA